MEYRDYITKDVERSLEETGCQPILFAGTGLSIRYFGAPSWNGLLRELAKRCPEIERPFAFYEQTHPNSIDIGQSFAESYQKWAWGDGNSAFPASLFEGGASKDIYLKHATAQLLEDLTPTSVDGVKAEALRKELECLQAIQPHAVITTNYDTFMETLFPQYLPVIGQAVLRRHYNSIGEILKIHGCVTDPASLVLTRDDFNEFEEKKKYVTAKLLTYLSEHTVLFAGYSASDPNIQGILANIDEILSPDGGLIPNMYFLERPGKDHHGSHAPEKLIQVGPRRSVRVKLIASNDFDWVFKAFAAKGPLTEVNTKLLRALLARTYELIRVDIPKQTVQVDYQILQDALSDEDGLTDVLNVLGITSTESPSTVNLAYPYILTQVGELLGFTGWHGADKLITRIKNETGIDIKESDNRYHSRIKSGTADGSFVRKYSQRAVALLRKVKDGKEYTLNLH